MSYLDIDDTLLSHIKDEAGYDSVKTNFKCLLHWCRNTEEPDARQALSDKLSRAAKLGLVSQKGVDVLRQLDQRNDASQGKDYPISISIGV